MDPYALEQGIGLKEIPRLKAIVGSKGKSTIKEAWVILEHFPVI